MLKQFFKNKGTRIWFIVTAAVLVLFLIINILVLGPLNLIVSSVLGTDRQVGRGDTMYYKTDEGITDKASALANANAVNEQNCAEGFILLKNDGILPISTKDGKPKVSVFGKNSVNLVYVGSGSGSGDVSKSKTIYDSLDSAGYEYNTTLKRFYEDKTRSGEGRPASLAIEAGFPQGFETGETPILSYDSDVKDSFKQYDDFALVVISRTGGEGNDLCKTMQSKGEAINGAASGDDHYLELDQNEQDMLQMVCESFSKVVLIVNSSNAMELGFLDDVQDGDLTVNDYDYASHIQAAIWIGSPGSTGIMSLGKLLNGEVNPSGRTPDTYVRDLTKDPTYVNFSAKQLVGSLSDQYLLNNAATNYTYIDYEEGIYVGYRYYETRCATEENGEEWYRQNVVFPFGYGLSYTDFRWTVDKSTVQGQEIVADKPISVTVQVENLGGYDGKDVVELYVRAPYVENEIEKADKVLCAFEKTELLKAESGKGEVTLTFNAYDLASYDYNNANHDADGHKGYELEAGTYTFLVGKNAHEAVDSFTMEVAKTIYFDDDKVENRYEDADDQLQTVLSRTDWEGTWPKARTEQEKTIDQAFVDQLLDTDSLNPITAESKEVKEYDLTVAKTKVDEGLKLYDLIGLDYNDPKWTEFMKRPTISSMVSVIDYACYGTNKTDANKMTYLGKPMTLEMDGPVGFVNFLSQGENFTYDVCVYASECVLAATFNKQCAYNMGRALGNEAIIGYEKDHVPYSGLYAPGINIHRSAFGGRNYEYYSEDCLLSGNMAAKMIIGTSEKGMYTFMKHFAVNEGETHRNGISTWLTEQAMREIYLKGFEIAIKASEGHAVGVMSSFNRIGTKWTGGDYRLLTEILRNEWGFSGAVICDFSTGQSYMGNRQMAYAGGDLNLNSMPIKSWVDAKNPVDIYVLKQCFKNFMFVLANSNVMNGLGSGIVLSVQMAYWKIALIVIDVAVVLGLAVWGIFAIRGYLKKKPINARK